MQKSLLGRMHLSKENEQIAKLYLDMDCKEDSTLLEKVKHQDLSSMFPINGNAEYLKWLQRKKRTEELVRYVRFITEVGGSTACYVLTNDNITDKMADIDSLLMYLNGTHAEELKIAVKVRLCVRALHTGDADEVQRWCQLGEEDPEVFQRAIKYCYENNAQEKNESILLFNAAYLHYKKAGEAPKIAETLAEGLIAQLPKLMAFSDNEIQYIQNFARTAKKDTPFPQRILSIYSERGRRSVDVRFVAGCAFLALKHSVQFEILFRLMVAVDSRYQGQNTALEIGKGIVEDNTFHASMEEIEEMLPMLDEDYIIWCLQAGCDMEIGRMAVKNPEGIKTAILKVDSEGYRKLAEIIQNVNPVLYGEIHASYPNLFYEKMASELVYRTYSNKEDIKQYLLGKCSAEEFAAQMQKRTPYDSYLSTEMYRRIDQLKTLGEIPFYRRIVVLEALKGMSCLFEEYSVFAKGDFEEAESKKGALLYDKRQIAGIFQIFAEENAPIWLSIKALGNICENLGKKEKTLFLEACVQVLIDLQHKAGKAQKEQWENSLIKILQEGNSSARCMCLKMLACEEDIIKFKKYLFEVAEDGLELVQKLLLEIIKEHPEWESDILALLTSKKLKARTFAVMVLEQWGQISYLEEAKAALGREKNKKLAAQLQTLVEELENTGTKESQQGQSYKEQKQLAAEIFKGGRKRKVEWVQDMKFPVVHFQDNISSNNQSFIEQEAASPEYMLSILAVYADMEVLGINQDAKKLVAPLVSQELAAYMHTLYDGWLTAGAEAKKRWVLYAAAIHGGAELIPVLHKQIKDWTEHSRGAIAAEAVHALALNGSSQALLLIDQMSRKFKSNQIKNAAKVALSNAAAALGISREELEDKIVPDFGFDAQMERVFDYGTRTFTVRLNLALEMEIHDGNGKQIKSLPVSGKQDDPEKANQALEEFKQIKKQLKTVVSSQKLRLEQALSMSRFWQGRNWKKLFVENPIMHQFAVGLIWGTYEGAQLKDTFRYMEDGSFNTVDEEEYIFPEDRSIGLVHPLELSEEELSAWKEQLSDYEIAQPIKQLERPVYRITEEEKAAQMLTRFEGEELDGMSLSRKLLSQGWVRGEVLDAGFFRNYYRSDSDFGAELTFSGCSIGYENEKVAIEKLYFYRVIEKESNKKEKCMPKEVSPRYFSEIVLQIAEIIETLSND